MSKGTTPFEQIQALLPRAVFTQVVTQWRGDYKVHFVDCWSHFLCLMVALLIRCNSLRDIQASVALRLTFYRRFGLQSGCRCTVARANAHRPAEVAGAFFQKLVMRCVAITPRHGLPFKSPLYSMDATVVDVCASLFPWAQVSPSQGMIKLLVVLDHDGVIPTDLQMASSREHEMKMAKALSFPSGSVICFDRGFSDLKWLHSLTDQECIFVTRLKSNINFKTIKHRKPRGEGVTADQIIQFTGKFSGPNYPERVRLIDLVDEEGQTYRFLTNQMTWPATTIATIYKARWKIETFFRWIKQNLKIKTFYGQSENAVRWQIWTAFCLYVLLAYLKYKLRLSWSLREIKLALERHLFETVNIDQLLTGNYQFQT
jgi:hypothetical protein